MGFLAYADIDTRADGGAGGSTMMDGGTFTGALAGGAKRCEPPNICPGPAMMAPNYLCADGTSRLPRASRWSKHLRVAHVPLNDARCAFSTWTGA